MDKIVRKLRLKLQFWFIIIELHCLYEGSAGGSVKLCSIVKFQSWNALFVPGHVRCLFMTFYCKIQDWISVFVIWYMASLQWWSLFYHFALTEIIFLVHASVMMLAPRMAALYRWSMLIANRHEKRLKISADLKIYEMSTFY